jgi:hypothetical protein
MVTPKREARGLPEDAVENLRSFLPTGVVAEIHRLADDYDTKRKVFERVSSLTRSAVSKECEELADHATALIRLLDSPVADWVGLVGAIGPDGLGGSIPEGWSPSDIPGGGKAIERLKVDLTNLRTLALWTHRVVDGSGRWTLDLPGGRQGGRKPSAAKPVVNLVLYAMRIYGHPIRSAPTSEAARAVAIVLKAFGFELASAENQVRQWLKRGDGPIVSNPIALDDDDAPVKRNATAARSRKPEKKGSVSS